MLMDLICQRIIYTKLEMASLTLLQQKQYVALDKWGLLVTRLSRLHGA
jgi:hypothetical protein